MLGHSISICRLIVLIAIMEIYRYFLFAWELDMIYGEIQTISKLIFLDW